jgi:hypothetical protein
MKRSQIIIVVLVLAAGTLSGLAIPRVSGDKGDQWEYLIVGNPSSVNLAPTDNPSMRKEPGGFGREDFVLEGNLDKLGRNGWELVTVTESPRFGASFIFKRRK